MKTVVALAVLVVCLPLPGRADSRYRFKMDHKIQVWIISPGLRNQQRTIPAAKLRVPVLIRFGAAPSAQVMAELTGEGVWFYPGVGGRKLLHLGLFFPARTSARGLAALARSVAVRQVDLARSQSGPAGLPGRRERWP